MIKCWVCIKEEKHNKIKWSQIQDAIVILQGVSYCYRHLENELGWKELKTEAEK